MVVVKCRDGQFHINKTMYSNLQNLKALIKNDWDGLVILDGYPGVGKSVLAQQFAYEVDPTINLDRIVFNIPDFEAAIDNNRNKAIIWDEAGDVASGHHLNKQIRSLKRKLSVCRDHNLYLFIIYPSFFELPKEISIFRSRFLVNVYDIFGKRGQYAVYGREEKKNLYIIGKKFMSYKKVRSNFIGTFADFKVLDWDAYKKKKRDAEAARLEDEPTGTRESKRRAHLAALCKWVKENYKLKDHEIAKILHKGSGFYASRGGISALLRGVS